MHFDQLTDKTRILVSLINCDRKQNKLFCGLVYFRGGMSGVATVTDGRSSFDIRVPEQVKNSATGLIVAHPEDKFEIEINA